ncbi:unnamed protein product [Lupinus luteus]|uniref:RING-type domain-containing protein n=1 Tax=Lupinus luteus TaxID=3873 RepID=A0AAV1YI01_LUPLU
MGAACCVAAKDKTVQSGPTYDILHRNIRCSPTWSFRWDHPARVAGEDAPSRNDESENKNESSYVSGDGSPLESDQRKQCLKYPISEGSAGLVINSTSDQSISTNVSMDVNVEQVKGLEESSTISCTSPIKPPSSLPSTSLSASPLPSQSHLVPSSSTSSRSPYQSPGHRLLWQVSNSRVPGCKSPSNFYVSDEKPVFPSWNNELSMHSCDGSSDGWSVPGFSELMGTSRRERWSFDSESFGFNPERLLRSSTQFSTSSVDFQTCGVCSKFLTEKSSWSSQKIIASNELAVVSILICGHVYHAECLESMTPEISKYDPACPVCTFGEKQTLKLSEKALKAEMDLKARNKKSKNQIVDSEIDDFVFDRFKDGGRQGKGHRMGSSSTGRRFFGKPFLRRHFSLGSNSSKSMLHNHPTKKKGFFWGKSSKQ